MLTRARQGAVTAFNATTWWGTVVLKAPKRRLAFHATCWLGATQTGLPKVGDSVIVIFSDETQKNLLSVQKVGV
jgi:hypothetical protein